MIGSRRLKKRSGPVGVLPLDLWRHISLFLPTDLIPLVCSRLRAAVPQRHLRAVLSSESTQPALTAFRGSQGVQGMCVTCKGVGEEAGELLGQLAAMPSLQELKVLLYVHQFQNFVGDRTVMALAALGASPTLRRLHIDLHCAFGGRGGGRVTDVGAGALAALGLAPRLESLVLDFGWNDVAGPGLRALCEGLRRAPRLKSLELTLTSTRAGDAGAAAVALLASAPALETLRLDMRCMGLTDAAGQSLAALRHCPRLRHLLLDVGCSALGDGGLAQLVAALTAAPHLQSLALSVNSTAVTPGGLQCLGTLRNSRTLQKLALVVGCDATDTTAEALASLATAPRLRSLMLDLHRSQVGDDGALALATLAHTGALESLTMDLSGTALGNPGAKGLVTALQKGSVRRLQLDVRATKLGCTGCRDLQALEHVRAWQRFQLFLGLCPGYASPECLTSLMHPPTQLVFDL